MVEFLGMLKVRIVRGINLAVRDLLSSDPYVCAILGGQVLMTLDRLKCLLVSISSMPVVLRSRVSSAILNSGGVIDLELTYSYFLDVPVER